MKHLSVFRRWAATAIASLPAGSSEEDVRQLLDEYFQRSDFAQMWAVSLDKQAISSQRLRRAERLFRRVQQPHLQGRPVLCVCAGAGEPGAAGNRHGAGCCEGGAGGPVTHAVRPVGRKPQPAGHRWVPLLIRQLFAAGAAITVDDFGAGHSNLTRILDLPEAGAVKLDRYVMRTCLARDPKLLAHLIDFVHDCGKLVIAQSVESASRSSSW